jgi:hypothetical protein
MNIIGKTFKGMDDKGDVRGLVVRVVAIDPPNYGFQKLIRMAILKENTHFKISAGALYFGISKDISEFYNHYIEVDAQLDIL